MHFVAESRVGPVLGHASNAAHTRVGSTGWCRASVAPVQRVSPAVQRKCCALVGVEQRKRGVNIKPPDLGEGGSWQAVQAWDRERMYAWHTTTMD